MPQISAMAILQLALLLSTLPAQYLISKWTSGDAAQRGLATQGILDTWIAARKSYLNMSVWVDWVWSRMPKVPLFGAEEELEHALGESLALDLLMHSNDQGYFGASPEVSRNIQIPHVQLVHPFRFSRIKQQALDHEDKSQVSEWQILKMGLMLTSSEDKRSPRPEYVLHRVGDVVLEKQNHMVGVIVGWDAGLRAPPEWIRRKKLMDSEVKRLEDTPHYRILFSGPDPSSLLIGYLPQTVIQLFEGYRPEIPTLGQYFSHFDGKRFVMQSWLKELYPED